MGFRAALEVVAFHATREALTFAVARDIYMLADFERSYCYLVAFFELGILDAKFAQKAQWR